MQTNRYDGKCHACGIPVPAGAGVLEYVSRYARRGRRDNPYQLWCSACYNSSKGSGPEDRVAPRPAPQEDLSEEAQDDE